MNLWKHQQEAVEKARLEPHRALFFDPGVGKTATMITILREEYTKNQRIDNTLIFAPITVCAQWKREFARFSKIPEDKILVLTGTGAKRTKELAKAKPGSIVVTNYESVQIKAFYEGLLRFSPQIIVMDESQRIKNASSVRCKLIQPLCHAARRRFILTGTPILNSLIDIYGQYKCFRPDLVPASEWQFRTKYFTNKNANNRFVKWPDWQPNADSQDLIGKIVSSTASQGKKSECLDLPPLLKIVVPVEMSAGQYKAYHDMRRDFVAEVKGDTVSAEFAITKTLRLQQIMAGFISDGVDNATWCDEVPRINALEELLESMGNEKCIIWTDFTPTYTKIGKLCEHLKLEYTYLTGQQSITEKNTAIEEFCNGSKQVLIANPAAGGVGVNLIQAKYAIYYTRSYSLEKYLQSEARNYRGGSELHDKVTHYHLVTTDTLDEQIMTALENKESIGKTVLAWAKNNS